jgi:uncharacterized protein (DUF1778 family)
MPKPKTKDCKITIRVEVEIRLILESLAEADDKTLSHYIRSELKKIAKQHNDKQAK